MSSSLIRGTTYLSFGQFVFLVSSYLTNIWLGKNLGPIDYGKYGLVISVMSLVNLIQISGLPQATARYISNNENEGDKVLKSSLVIQFISTLLISFVFFVLAHPLGLLFKDLSLVPYLRLSALVFPLYGLYSLYSGYYNGRQMFGRQAAVNIAYSIGKLIGVIGLTMVWGLYGAIVGFVIAPVLAVILGWKWPRTTGAFPFRKLVLFSLPLIGFAVLSMLQQSVDLYFIKALSEVPEAAGWYTANQNIARIPFYALGAFSLVLFPSISKTEGDRDRQKTRKLISTSMRYVILILVPITLIMAQASEQLLGLLYSEAYVPGAESLEILIYGLGFLTIFSILANILNGAGKPKVSMLISGVGLSVTALLSWRWIPAFGLSGAAWSTLAGSALAMILAGGYIYREWGSWFKALNLVRIVGSGVLIFFLGSQISTQIRMLPFVSAGLLGIYGLMLLLTREIKVSDIRYLRSIWK